MLPCGTPLITEDAVHVISPTCWVRSHISVFEGVTTDTDIIYLVHTYGNRDNVKSFPQIKENS